MLFAAILAVAGMRLWSGELAEVVTGAFALSAIAVVFGATLILAVAAPAETPQTRFFGCSPLRFFGKHSYAIYVFHQAVALPLTALGITAVCLSPVADFALPGQLAFVALGTTLPVAAALRSWHLYEKHFLRLKDRFSYGLRDAGKLHAAGVATVAVPT